MANLPTLPAGMKVVRNWTEGNPSNRIGREGWRMVKEWQPVIPEPPIPKEVDLSLVCQALEQIGRAVTDLAAKDLSVTIPPMPERKLTPWVFEVQYDNFGKPTKYLARPERI